MDGSAIQDHENKCWAIWPLGIDLTVMVAATREAAMTVISKSVGRTVILCWWYVGLYEAMGYSVLGENPFCL